MKWSKLGIVMLSVVHLAACDRIPGTPESNARNAILGQLIDPDSAKITYLQESSSNICGTVNAKNRMGGYTGARPFIYDRMLQTVSMYAEAPSLDDYRLWADTQEGEAQNEQYFKIQSGCQFPEAWRQKCGSDPASIMEIHDQFCGLWLKNDMATLFKESHPN